MAKWAGGIQKGASQPWLTDPFLGAKQFLNRRRRLTFYESEVGVISGITPIAPAIPCKDRVKATRSGLLRPAITSSSISKANLVAFRKRVSPRAVSSIVYRRLSLRSSTRAIAWSALSSSRLVTIALGTRPSALPNSCWDIGGNAWRAARSPQCFGRSPRGAILSAKPSVIALPILLSKNPVVRKSGLVSRAFILYLVRMILAKNDSRVFWICAFVTILSFIISAGFAVANVATHGLGDTSALYGASRSIPILLVAIVAAVRRSNLGVATVALIMTFVQVGDAMVGVLAHDTSKTLGPLILALATAITLVWLLRKYNESSAKVPYSQEGILP